MASISKCFLAILSLLQLVRTSSVEKPVELNPDECLKLLLDVKDYNRASQIIDHPNLLKRDRVTDLITGEHPFLIQYLDPKVKYELFIYCLQESLTKAGKLFILFTEDEIKELVLNFIPSRLDSMKLWNRLAHIENIQPYLEELFTHFKGPLLYVRLALQVPWNKNIVGDERELSGGVSELFLDEFEQVCKEFAECQTHLITSFDFLKEQKSEKTSQKVTFHPEIIKTNVLQTRRIRVKSLLPCTCLPDDPLMGKLAVAVYRNTGLNHMQIAQKRRDANLELKRALWMLLPLGSYNERDEKEEESTMSTECPLCTCSILSQSRLTTEMYRQCFGKFPQDSKACIGKAVSPVAFLQAYGFLDELNQRLSFLSQLSPNRLAFIKKYLIDAVIEEAPVALNVMSSMECFWADSILILLVDEAELLLDLAKLVLVHLASQTLMVDLMGFKQEIKDQTDF